MSKPELGSDDLPRALALYRAGEKVAAIIAATGVNSQVLYDHLHRAGISLRVPALGTAAPFRQARSRAEKARQMAAVYPDETRRRWIRRQMGVSDA